LWPEQDSNLHELYSVSQHLYRDNSYYFHRTCYPILPLIYLTCLTDRLIIHSRPITLAASYAIRYKPPILQDRDITLQGSLSPSSTYCPTGGNVTRAYLTQQTWHLTFLIYASGYLDSALWCLYHIFSAPTSLLFNVS
jgi:hypothetical protein